VAELFHPDIKCLMSYLNNRESTLAILVKFAGRLCVKVFITASLHPITAVNEGRFLGKIIRCFDSQSANMQWYQKVNAGENMNVGVPTQ
jgi:hypothetical protein